MQAGFMNAEHPDRADRRIPVTVLTGFLGAGKTTLLNGLLKQPGMADCAVLINEFGEVGVDHHLVEKVDDTLIVLDSGCICCSVQGDLVKALKNLFMRALRREITAPARVVIETTGLADPAPVVHTLMEEPFIAERYRCDGVITAVDATHAQAQLDRHREAVRQVAMADRLLLTKCDLCAPPLRAALTERLAAFNPGAQQIEVFHGAVTPDVIAGCGLYDPGNKVPDVAEWLGEERVRAQARRAARLSAGPVWRRPGKGGEGAVMPAAPAASDPASAHSPARHDDGVASHVLRFAAPLDWYAFSDGLGLLLQVYGERILRIKGLLNVAGDPLPRVLQCVQHAVYPPTSLAAWPSTPPYNDGQSRLVFIVRDLPREEIEHILGSFAGQPPLPAESRSDA